MDARVPIPVEQIEHNIYLIRGRKVMLDNDLAELYGIETKQLKRAVKRNADRFPSDFMFVVTSCEYDSLRYQFGTLNRGAHSKYPPFAFTEQGVAMLSSVLNSKRAIQVNIEIMRVFTRLRQLHVNSAELKLEIDELKRQTNDRFQIVFKTLDHLLAIEDKPRRKIGFTAKEKRAVYSVKQEA
jgi:phage regulator Rha-like protein